MTVHATCVFFFRTLIVSGLKGFNPLWISFCLWCDSGLVCFACGCPVFLALFIGDCPFSIVYLFLCCKLIVHICKCLFIFFLPIPCGFDYYGFVIYFVIRKHNVSALFFFLRIELTTHIFFCVVPYAFWDCFCYLYNKNIGYRNICKSHKKMV